MTDYERELIDIYINEHQSYKTSINPTDHKTKSIAYLYAKFDKFHHKKKRK